MGDVAVVRLTWTLTTEVNGVKNRTTEEGMDIFRRQPDGRWSIARVRHHSGSPASNRVSAEIGDDIRTNRGFPFNCLVATGLLRSLHQRREVHWPASSENWRRSSLQMLSATRA